MKVYSIDYSLNERSPKKITVTPHSDIKIAIKAEEDGCILSECDIALYKSDGCVLTPDEEMIDDYKVWTVETTDSGTEEYKVDIKGNEFKLTQFVNDSTIFEVDEQGGGGCGCGDSLWEEDGCYIAPKNGFPIVVHSNDASDINDICFNGCIGFGGEESTDYCGSQMEYGCAII